MRSPIWRGYSDDLGERRREVHGQIRRKADHMRRIRGVRGGILSLRRRAHRRAPDEYIRPDRTLHMSTWETASSIDTGDSRTFDERPLTWVGVRGSMYADPARWHYPPGHSLKTWGELVPEPFNKYDSTAVAIDLDGIRLGYAPADYARYVHTCVCALNNRGFRVLIPLEYRSDYSSTVDLLCASAYAALPTFREFDKLLPTDEECARLLQPLWDALDDSDREQISRDRYGLTEQTLPHLVALRHLAPEVGIPSIPRLSAVTYQVNRFVKSQQVAWRRNRDAEIVAAYQDGWRKADITRLHGVSASVVSRVLKEAGVDARSPRVNPEARRVRTEIVTMLEGGSSRREVAAALGVTDYTITAAAKEAGITVPSRAGLNDYSRAQMRARLEKCERAVQLQEQGCSRAEIGLQLGVSNNMVKTYLADGRFFEDPESNSDRLDRARALREAGAKESQLVTSADRRALRDASMLDLIGKLWSQDSSHGLVLPSLEEER